MSVIAINLGETEVQSMGCSKTSDAVVEREIADKQQGRIGMYNLVVPVYHSIYLKPKLFQDQTGPRFGTNNNFTVI